MYKKLILFRNELKNKRVPVYKLIGIVSELLLSREMFKKNSEITLFLKDVFNLSYKAYVMKSRTLIVARTGKVIYTADDKEYRDFKYNLLRFIDNSINDMKSQEKIKTERNDFDGWLNKINEERHDI